MAVMKQVQLKGGRGLGCGDGGRGGGGSGGWGDGRGALSECGIYPHGHIHT